MPVNTNAADIINALKDSANDTLKALLGSTPLQAYAIGQEGNFPCNWQSTLNVTLFNKPTYDWITMNLKAGHRRCRRTSRSPTCTPRPSHKSHTRCRAPISPN